VDELFGKIGFCLALRGAFLFDNFAVVFMLLDEKHILWYTRK